MLGPPRTECLEHIAKEVARHRPTHLVIDLGPWPFTPDPGMLTALSEVHRGWVIRGFKVGYSATRPASRGAAVVVMHRADDMDGIVAATAGGAERRAMASGGFPRLAAPHAIAYFLSRT